MKRVINVIVSIVILGFILYFLKFYTGGYIPIDSKKESTAVFLVQDGEIYSNRHDKLTKITVKGVNIDNFIPSHNPSDYAIDKKTWLRWFEEIASMGANTIRITNIYNPTFYNAFYEYNSKAEKPLYLIQGITVSDYVNNNSNDAYDGEFYQKLREYGLCVVDVIYGNRNIMDNNVHGSGVYRKDISKWVLGYLVGNEWNSDTIAYTNNKDEEKGGAYRGTYLSTTENANAFEVMLCKIMDAMVSYESHKYHKQRLISFANSPSSDPFIYEEGYDLLYNKYVDIDIEDIKQRHYKGLYVAYSIYELGNNYEIELSERTKNKLHNITEIGDKEGYLHGYLEILTKYHSYPVIVTAFECSTTRGVLKGTEPYTEQEQGQILVENYNNIIASGAKGAFIESWQDSWVKQSSNTLYGINTTHAENWHDMQTVSQNKGILAFEPLNAYQTVYLDGEFEDFDKAVQVGTFNNMTVKYSYDANYMYFAIQGNKDFATTPTYIAFDITPNSGAFKYTSNDNTQFKFERGADFVLQIDGKENTKLYVQERYDGFIENYTDTLTKTDAFANPPLKNSEIFNVIGMLQQIQRADDSTYENMSIDDYLEVLKVRRYDTGNFTYGISNPSSEEFNSLADFCFGTNGVEVRIPWTLLNFSDPSQCFVHKDYYECYGREDMKISEFYIGVGDVNNTNIDFAPIKLTPWNTVEVEERLKSSYNIIKEAWNGIK